MRVLLATLLLLAPTAARAGWSDAGVRVSWGSGSHQLAHLAHDGSGGAFVGWGTWEAPPLDEHNGYMLRLTAAGDLAPGWPLLGLSIGSGPANQGIAALTPDGAGGVLVLYADGTLDPLGDLYLQRLTAAGTMYPGWPAGGVPVVVVPGDQSAVFMVGDAAGGAWVSWGDRRDPSHYMGYFTHILGDGSLAPGWPENGRPLEVSPRIFGSAALVATDDGGVLAAWGRTDDGLAYGIRGQRFGPDGAPSPAWPPNGADVCIPVVGGGALRWIVGDGAGGLYAVWEDFRAYDPDDNPDDIDVYAQHILGDGTRAPGWPADGLAVSALPRVRQSEVSLCEDGRGGVYIAWDDYRAGWSQLYGQHLRGDGTPYPGWPAGGRLLSNLYTWHFLPNLVWDGDDGAYVSWMSYGGDYRSYVSKLTPDGTPAPGWAPDGVSVAPAVGGDQFAPVGASDGEGGMLVAWEAGAKIYAQRFVRDGIVAASVSLVSAEAGAGQVRLLWQLSGATSAELERRTDDAGWQRRATLAADAGGRIEYTDPDVTPGRRYEYRLALAGGGYGGEAAVEVPGTFVLTLAGARPNPARGTVTLAFTLPDAAPATLALYDLAGRRLAAREVGTLGAGRHAVPLAGAPLAPGLYWAALAQGEHVLRARVAVVR